MAKRKIKRRRGEGIEISGRAIVCVSRGVTLVIDAPRDAQVARITRAASRKRPGWKPSSPPEASPLAKETEETYPPKNAHES